MLHQFPYLALFFPELSQLSYPLLSFFHLFLLESEFLFLLYLSPVSEYLCPSIMIVGLGFAKLDPFFYVLTVIAITDTQAYCYIDYIILLL